MYTVCPNRLVDFYLICCYISMDIKNSRKQICIFVLTYILSKYTRQLVNNPEYKFMYQKGVAVKLIQLWSSKARWFFEIISQIFKHQICGFFKTWIEAHGVSKVLPRLWPYINEEVRSRKHYSRPPINAGAAALLGSE